MRKLTIHDPIFGASLTLLIGSAEQYNRFMCKKFPKFKKEDFAREDEMGLYESRKLPDKSKDRYIWMPEWKNDDEHRDTLMHETDHASHEMLLYVCMVRTKASEECFVYHKTWLYRECLKRLNGGKYGKTS